MHQAYRFFFSDPSNMSSNKDDILKNNHDHVVIANVIEALSKDNCDTLLLRKFGGRSPKPTANILINILREAGYDVQYGKRFKDVDALQTESVPANTELANKQVEATYINNGVNHFLVYPADLVGLSSYDGIRHIVGAKRRPHPTDKDRVAPFVGDDCMLPSPKMPKVTDFVIKRLAKKIRSMFNQNNAEKMSVKRATELAKATFNPVVEVPNTQETADTVAENTDTPTTPPQA